MYLTKINCCAHSVKLTFRTKKNRKCLFSTCECKPVSERKHVTPYFCGSKYNLKYSWDFHWRHKAGKQTLVMEAAFDSHDCSLDFERCIHVFHFWISERKLKSVHCPDACSIWCRSQKVIFPNTSDLWGIHMLHALFVSWVYLHFLFFAKNPNTIMIWWIVATRIIFPLTHTHGFSKDISI
jgi:hypothetical protein